MSHDLAGHNCRHCLKRLHFGATATICRKCRFDGHREFGDCIKYPSDIPIANSHLSNEISETAKLS